MPTPAGRKSPGQKASELSSGQSPTVVCGLGKYLVDKDVDLIAGSRPFRPPRPKSLKAAGTVSPTTPRQLPLKDLKVFGEPNGAIGQSVTKSAQSTARKMAEMNKLALNSHSKTGARPEAQLQTFPRPARAAVVCDGGLSADDCVDADRVPLSMSSTERGCYRLRKVSIDALQNDGTLGLLLHGTSVVGFRCMQAEANGWKKGDQIVEINGRRAGNFDEFQECFRTSQREDGFPITFSVLRREEALDMDETAASNADDALTNFFSTTDFTNLAGQLQKKWGEEAKQKNTASPDSATEKVDKKPLTKNPSESNFTMDNPYIVALQRRRDALFRSNEGWAKWADDDYVEATETVASQLAQKHDGVSMLNFADEALKERDVCGVPDIFCTPTCGGAERAFELIEIEMMPTPRVHRYDALNSRDSRDPPWLIEAASRASRMDLEDELEHLDLGFLESLDSPEEIATSEVKPLPNGNADMPDLEDGDADFLAQLLLSSEEFRLPSDEEEEDEAMAVPRNIAGTLIRRVGSGDI